MKYAVHVYHHLTSGGAQLRPPDSAIFLHNDRLQVTVVRY